MTDNVQDIKSLFRQEFVFQGASTRVGVSVSSDGQLVLKRPLTAEQIEQAFRRYGIDLAAVDWSPCPGNARVAAQRLGDMSMESYKVAWDKLRDEAALLYVGPHPDDESQFVILQQRVQLFVDFITQQVYDGQHSKARWAIDALLALTRRMWEQEITENTFNFADNYGFLNEPSGPRIVLVDIGELETGAEPVSRYALHETMLKSQSFTRWLKPTHPQLASYLQEGFRGLASSF